jgi:hypothetical protein
LLWLFARLVRGTAGTRSPVVGSIARAGPDGPTETEPLSAMLPPDSFFRAVTASTRSPSSCAEFRQVNSSFSFDTTTLRASPSALAKPASTPPGVFAAGRLALRPRAGEAVVGLATEEDGVGGAEGRVDGGAHILVEVREVPRSGASTTPSSEMNRPTVIFLMVFSSTEWSVPASSHQTVPAHRSHRRRSRV